MALVTITAADIQVMFPSRAYRRTIEELTAALKVCTALVEQYTTDAPEEVMNEVAIRVLGYLSEHPDVGITLETVGPMTRQWDTNKISAMRHSGAMALLTPFKKRRAGVIQS